MVPSELIWPRAHATLALVAPTLGTRLPRTQAILDYTAGGLRRARRVAARSIPSRRELRRMVASRGEKVAGAVAGVRQQAISAFVSPKGPRAQAISDFVSATAGGGLRRRTAEALAGGLRRARREAQNSRGALRRALRRRGRGREREPISTASTAHRGALRRSARRSSGGAPRRVQFDDKVEFFEYEQPEFIADWLVITKSRKERLLEGLGGLQLVYNGALHGKECRSKLGALFLAGVTVGVGVGVSLVGMQPRLV